MNYYSQYFHQIYSKVLKKYYLNSITQNSQLKKYTYFHTTLLFAIKKIII